MQTQSIRNERVDIRLTPEEKKLFLRARELSRDRSLSAFITRIVKTKALDIIEEYEQILATERDRKIFFDAVFSDIEPNNTLKDAAKKFNSLQD